MKFFIFWQGKPSEQIHNSTNMKRSIFWAFVQKEFFHIFRDTWTTIILLGLPIMMTVLFGFGISTEFKNTRFAVYDPSHDVATQSIVTKLNQSNYFILDRYLTSPEEANQLFKKGEIGLFVVFSERFHENLLHTGDAQVQLITDGTDPNTASLLVGYATNLILNYQQNVSVSATSIPAQIVPTVRLLYNPTMKGVYSTVPGVLGMVLMLVCAMMTSVSIVREKELGTMEVLLVSPLKPIVLILSKAVPYFVLSLIDMVIILFLAVFILHVPIVGSLLLLVVVSLLYIFVNLALGLVISSIAKSQMIAVLISALVLMMPAMMLTGMLFPTENMPLFFRLISNILPAKWFIIAIKSIMIKGMGFSFVFKEIAILIFMGVFLIGVSIKNFKNRLE
jgi:ABC-2 type transport system permease protein